MKLYDIEFVIGGMEDSTRIESDTRQQAIETVMSAYPDAFIEQVRRI